MMQLASVRPSAEEEESTPAAEETHGLRLDGHAYHNASSCKRQVVRDELNTQRLDFLYFI